MPAQNLLLTAARAAQEATKRSILEWSKPLPQADPAEVERIIAGLPEQAGMGREKYPEIASFAVFRCKPVPLDRRLSEAVLVGLRALGLSAEIRRSTAREQLVDGLESVVEVTYASLFAAADAQRGVAWQAEASKLWTERGGLNLWMRPADHLPVFVAPEQLNRPHLRRESIGPVDYLDLDPSVLVEQAARELMLPAYRSVPALQVAWTERAGAGSALELLAGRWVDGAHRAVPCLTFIAIASGSTRPWSIDETDVHEWSVADLIAMAADECGLEATVPPAPPPRPAKPRRGERQAAA